MTKNTEELISDAINTITQKTSELMLQEFLDQPSELQLNLVLIKSAQLLLANILCHTAMSKDELNKIIEMQGEDIKEMTLNCAFTAFANKFGLSKH